MLIQIAHAEVLELCLHEQLGYTLKGTQKSTSPGMSVKGYPANTTCAMYVPGPKAKQLEGEECPLHVQHPPTGEEFALGCGVCRNAHTF